ncbi:MAG: hypothetical protein IPK80_15860 [Nannocystis sp.]|nr:hypothetical protein [Nannocystis sp.]
MIIEVGSQRYKEIFGARDFLTQLFQSRLPPHRLVVEALADPPKSITAIDTLLADANPNGVLHSAGLQDIHLGTRCSCTPASPPHASAASSSSPRQRPLEQPRRRPRRRREAFCNSSAPATPTSKPSSSEASFAVGMKALGAIGPVGKIAAAVIGFARRSSSSSNNAASSKKTTPNARSPRLRQAPPPRA